MPRPASPPALPGHWLLGNLREFRQDMLGVYARCARECGDIASYRIGPRRLLFLSHPEYIEQVLVTENRKFIKHYALRLLKPTLGEGLLTSDGEFWLRQRRLMQPAFSKQRVESYGPIIVDYTQKMLATWRSGEMRDLHADMMQLALSIVSKALLDVDAGEKSHEVSSAIDWIMRDFNSRFQSAVPLPFGLPIPRNFALKRQVRLLESVIQQIINERRADRRDHGDLLSVLVHARDEQDQTGMTDRQLRDEVMTLFLAGHETTANLLSWTWYLLATHPEVEAKVRSELELVLAGRPPAAADAPRLTYIEQVLLETMRLYPPAYAMGRESVEECTIGGYRIPAGSTVIMSQYVMHRHPRYFDRADEFDPDRWSGGLMKRLPKYVYFPFGAGPRVCIGNSFALLEAMLVVATVVPRFQFSLAAHPPVVPWPSVTLRPREGIHAVVHERLRGGASGSPEQRDRASVVRV
ncbi:MAG: cytochrome P450 [Deltaproteobacteria bacterium]